LSKGATTGKVEEIGMVPVLGGYGHVISDDYQDTFDHFLCVRGMQGELCFIHNDASPCLNMAWVGIIIAGDLRALARVC
jgi:hypothetical protein